MSELGDLLIGISVLLGSGASAFALIWTTVRSGRKPEQVGRSAAEESAAALLQAIADGDLSPEELEEIRQRIEGGDPP